ncbi:hypothetical protein DAPPUDRAFT_319292 [Daphnia pulex]|uniref:small monomeric GTPase n=1 Tax=Daphnia pulex TaxID=6669 RepID=E9GL96_DAPPU|nr:hypothetical protein DAPPUDRAFT_319292 [Daphnia pulex]|eukprot:EFX79833.1 hypothetical protein DAPPUDRAFT_319292 [Daphnia pulex]
MKSGIQYQIKVIIIGARQVGKSALTVRYLTRRYIGEYKSHTDLSYRQVFCIDGSSIEVEIVDVSNHPEDTSVPVTRAKNSDACVVVYSISDRTSFKAAHEALAALQASSQRKSFEDDNKEEQEINPAPLSVPVVLLANKKDLGHLRQVEADEGRELAKQFSCVFCEVSAADPAESEPEDLAGIFNQLIKEARSFKIRQQDTNNNAHNNNNGSSNNNRQRKRSVYIINRMLGSLMGRNSMPPELPSSRKGGTSQMASSMPNVAGSFRSVFKKRSV